MKTDPEKLLFNLRIMHAWMVVSHIVRVFTEYEENELIHMVVKAAEIWGYLMTICFCQYYLMIQTQNDASVESDKFLKSQYIEDWILIEVLIFYFRIFNSTLFLFCISLRGALGYKDIEANEERFKYDALDYYELDINWASYQTVPIMLMCNFLWRVKNQDDLSATKIS